jgi:hypothetical protein
VVKKGDKYDFRLALKKGMVYTIRITTSVPMPGQSKPMEVDIVTTSRVLDKKGDIATVEVTNSGQIFGGTGKPTIVQMNSRGTVVKGNVMSNQGVLVPPRPIKIGEKWSGSNGIGTPAGMGSSNATFTFTGIKTINGKQYAVINVASIVTGAIKANLSGTSYVSMTDGLLSNSALTANMDQVNPETKKVVRNKLKIKVTRN